MSRLKNPRFQWNPAKTHQLIQLYRDGIRGESAARQIGCKPAAYYRKLHNLRKQGTSGLERDGEPATRKPVPKPLAAPTPLKRAGMQLVKMAGENGKGKVPVLIALTDENYAWLRDHNLGATDDAASDLLNRLLEDDRAAEQAGG